MTIEKHVSVDLIEVMESGSVNVRTSTKLVEEGRVLASSFHRHALTPGADVSGETERVRAVCMAVWTPEVVAAYKEASASA